MPDSRGGHHGDVSYVFEDNGFNSAPTDENFKNFGGNAVMDTQEGSHNAVRVFNADRKAAEVIEQTFSGSWSITTDGFTEPPWWLAGLFGQPNSTEVTAPLYDHEYSLANDNDPVPLRLYEPTDGFSEYKVLQGCVIASVTVDQDNQGSPEISISGAYAEGPTTDNTLTPTPPSFAKSSFTNRDAELQCDGDTVGRAQSTSVSLEANAEMVNEIGAEYAVDFIPRAWEPSMDWDKILWVGQTVDPLAKFDDGSTYASSLTYDNGESADAQYRVELNVTGALPNDWSESGRNDPDADLTESLSEMAADATATVTVDETSPPGV